MDRKGTGNYDKERTKFNYSYIPLSTPTLQEQVYSKLQENKIYYNDGKNTNLLNGAIVTSGKEFFQCLGIKFKESDRTNQVGANIHHKTKALKEIEDLNEQISEMKIEFERNKKLNDIEIETSKEISEIGSEEILNPIKRKIIRYKDEDINKLVDYSKQKHKTKFK